MGLKVTGRAGKAPCIRITHTRRLITGNHWNKNIMFFYVMLANICADFTPNLSILILEQWERTSSKCSKLCRETKGALSGIFWTRLGKLNPKLNYQLPPPPSKTNKGKKKKKTKQTVATSKSCLQGSNRTSASTFMSSYQNSTKQQHLCAANSLLDTPKQWGQRDGGRCCSAGSTTAWSLA